MIFALKKIKSGRAFRPADIPIEAWKSLGDVGVTWLVTKKILDIWRKSILVPIYKNKGDIQSYIDYRGIKLMCHTVKL